MDKTQINLERIRACDDGWNENTHPRSENGQFTSGGGGGSKTQALKNVTKALTGSYKPAEVKNKNEALERVAKLYKEQDKPDFEKNPNAVAMLEEREKLVKKFGITYSDVEKAYKGSK